MTVTVAKEISKNVRTIITGGAEMKRISLLLTIAILILMSSDTIALRQKDGQVELKDQNVVTVIRKLIHVIVTDHKGNPISDLRKDEFILYDNGREKTITEFENHMLSLPAEKRRPLAADPIKEPPIPQTPLMNRTFFFLFDFARPDLQEKPVFCLSELSAPPGTYKCRFVLRNMETGLTAVAAAATIVPKTDSKSFLLYPPRLRDLNRGSSKFSRLSDYLPTHSSLISEYR